MRWNVTVFKEIILQVFQEESLYCFYMFVDIFLFKIFQPCFWSLPAFSKDTWGTFQMIKQLAYGADHSPPSRTEINHTWQMDLIFHYSYTSRRIEVQLQRYLIVIGYKFMSEIEYNLTRVRSMSSSSSSSSREGAERHEFYTGIQFFAALVYICSGSCFVCATV